MPPGESEREARRALESALRRDVLAGSESAWRVLHDRAFDALDAHVRARSGAVPSLADEVVQETWIVAVRRIRAFDPGRAAFATWLRGIADNVLRAAMRRQARDATEPAREFPAGGADTASSETSARVRAALLRLPERYREVLRAKYIERRAVVEIARSLGASPKATESLLSRAREAFRRTFDQGGDAS